MGTDLKANKFETKVDSLLGMSASYLKNISTVGFARFNNKHTDRLTPPHFRNSKDID